MAAGDYRRLVCGGCKVEFSVLAQAGRPRKWCETCQPERWRFGKQPQDSCSVEGCERTGKVVRGLCSIHYWRSRQHGELGPRTQVCRQCQREFVAIRKKMYCSKQCCATAKDRRNGMRPLAQYKAEVRNPAAWFKCEQCGKDSHRSQSGRNRERGYPNRFCSLTCRDESRAAQKPAPSSQLYLGKCADCQDWLSTRRPSIHCWTCSADRAARRAYLIGIERHRREAKVSTCNACGVEYCRLYRSSPGSHCSSDCEQDTYREWKRASRKKGKAMRRAQMVESVSPRRVFERDGWHCYLCGQPTPPEYRGTFHPQAPELEHVVPLSKGGHHSYANCRCACRQCNIAKADRPAHRRARPLGSPIQYGLCL